jgi:metal-responsive CopG/Arc/MetJ family transcriptional regulator
MARTSTIPTTQIAIRLPNELLEQVDERLREINTATRFPPATRSDVVRDALRRHLTPPPGRTR